MVSSDTCIWKLVPRGIRREDALAVWAIADLGVKDKNINTEGMVGTDLDSRYSESRYRMCVPKADTGRQRDGLVIGELFDDLVDVYTGKV